MTADLIARLEAAERGSAELDLAMWLAVGAVVEKRQSDRKAWLYYSAKSYPRDDPRFPSQQRRLTRSLDAIAALTAEKLPGWDWHASTHRRKGVAAVNDGSNDWTWITAATPALALCSALLRAMERIER